MTNYLEQLHNVSPKIIERGKQYYEEGKISNFHAESHIFYGKVEGNEGYYDTYVTIKDNKLENYSCSCPCNFLCKHVVALLFKVEEELCETAVGNYTATAIGNTGDGITMALEVGAVLDDFQESMSGIFAPDPYDMPVVGQPYNSYPYECLLLNTKGERKISETAGTHDQMIYFVNDGEADYGWVIMDQEIADQFLNLDEYLDKTTCSSVIQAYKETSIDALADDIGMSKEVLENAIDRYNSMCDNQKDTDCGKDSQYLSAIDDGTYYAVKEYNCTRGNYGGILTNENAEVIDQDGKTISGLYAAGIISSGSYFGDYYPGCEALAVGAHMGYIAGKNAYSYSQQ